MSGRRDAEDEIVGHDMTCTNCRHAKPVTDFRWIKARQRRAPRCKTCDLATSWKARIEKAAARGDLPKAERQRPERHNVIAPELRRAVRRIDERDRPKCPTCGQHAPRGDGAFMLKWSHRDQLGEPCPGWSSNNAMAHE